MESDIINLKVMFTIKSLQMAIGQKYIILTIKIITLKQ